MSLRRFPLVIFLFLLAACGGNDACRLRAVRVIRQAKLFGNSASTFLGNSYQTVVTEDSLTLYRCFGNSAKLNGSYATPVENATREGLAILTAWNNSMQFKVVIKVPPRETLNVGIAGPQPLPPQSAVFNGGTEQVILPFNWPSRWARKVIDLQSGKTFTPDAFRKAYPALVN